MADEGEATLSDDFWAVARELRRRSRAMLAPWDISPSHARALGVLEQHTSIRLTELAERLHIAPRSATEVVDALQSHGLVERQPDPDDRRATLVMMTDDGKHVSAAVRITRTADAERVFAELSETDRAHLGRILRKLARSSATGTPSAAHTTRRTAASGQQS